MTIDFCDKSDYLSIASFIIEEHRLAKKVCRILESIHGIQEKEISSDKRIIIFENIHPDTVCDSYIDWESKDESPENILLRRRTEVIGFLNFREDFIIHAGTDDRLINSSRRSFCYPILRTEKEHNQKESKNTSTQENYVSNRSKHRTIIRRRSKMQAGKMRKTIPSMRLFSGA